MSDVVLRVLGPLRAAVDGAAADLGGPARRAVLARLAVAGGDVVATDTIIDDLWHGEPSPRALGTLQVHVSHLRRALEPARPPRAPATVLLSTPPGYALALPPDALDSHRFTGLLDAAGSAGPAAAAGLLRDALACWSGPAFAEFATQPWAVAEVARLEELRLEATERLAEARLGTGDPAAAVADLERLLHDHPLREGAVRLLALALYRAGRQSDALAVLARARRTLAAELGVDPGPELRALERDVLAHVDHELRTAEPPVRPAVAAPRPAPPHPAPDLVGRDRELARLRGAADRVRSSGVQVVLISSDAGGGKSALVSAFRADRAAAGWTTALGRCPEVDGAPPAWAWRELVTDVLAARPADRAWAARLEALNTGPTSTAETFWLSRAAVDLIGAAARSHPLLLVIDDLHRAEGETLQLLRSVVGGLAAAPVLVIVTVRPADVGADVEAALAALAEPTADRIAIAGLHPDDVGTLLARHGVTGADPETIALVTERTGGNPLFVRELARLVAVEGIAAAGHAVPAGVRDVLRRRLARLPGPAQTVLRHAAVLGRDVDVDTLLQLTGDEDAALDALEVGVLTGLLSEPAPGQVRFAHALVCDTLYADVPRLRRTRLHAAALEVLAGTRPDDHAVLAHHALAAGPAVAPARALEHAAAAAAAADRFGARREAARLWGAAVGLAGSAQVDTEREIALRCAHVSALAHAGDGVAAVTARAAAVALARGTDLLNDALTSYDAPVSWTIRPDSRVDTALVGLIETALAATPPPAVELRCRLLVALVFELESHDDERVRSASAEAMALSAGHGDPLLRCAALNARFFAALSPDLWPELEGVGTELVTIAEASGLAGYRSQGHHLLFMVSAARHDLDGAQHHVDAAVAAATGGQLGMTLGWATIFAALRALVRGDLDAAEARYTEVARRLAAAGVVNAELIGFVGRFAVRHARGRHGELVDEMAALRPHMPPTFSDFLASGLLAAGRPDDARAGWRPDVVLPRNYYWQLWTVLRAEVAVGLGDREVAARCYDELLPWAGTFAGLSSGTVTLGPVDRVLADLAALLGHPPEQQAAHRRAAAALAASMGAKAAIGGS
ncbi:BTAD domain-containing putative transcriptional regulator [Pseudonocardia sp. GCM10023141]|uniref:BTAD domain-containing putative transcriptional regulator n=1 Tax=Pseudonocardia sp. GCM10023141 TaxID=3252653 RepID=UPI00360D90C4